MCASLERQLSTSAAFMSDKEKDRIHSIAFSFHLFYILKHTILHFSLPLLAEWHPLKQKCCKAMLSPTSFFFFFRYHHLHLLRYEKKKVSFTGNVCHMFHSTFGCILFINKIKVGYMRLFFNVMKTTSSEPASPHRNTYI